MKTIESSESSARKHKPKSVSRAVKLLWLSYIIGLIRLPMDFSALTATGSLAYPLFVAFFTFVVIGYLIFRISVGENWARLTFLVLLIIGLLPTLPQIMNEISRAPLTAAFTITHISIQAYALYLLFTSPGRDWFIKDNKPAE